MKHTAITAGTLAIILGAGYASAAGTHASGEPTWTYQGQVATTSNDSGPKMKHLTVVYDPQGLAGVSGNPNFLMVWGTSSADQLYTKTSDDGLSWSTHSQASVAFPGTTVPVYHPEVIYDRQGFNEKKSTGDVHFKMWFYDAGTEGYNWIRYAESADGANWQIYEDSPDAGSSGKNYLEFSGGSGNEMSVLYRRGGTGIFIDGADQEYVGYQATGGPVGKTTDGAWFATVTGQGGGPTDVCREMAIAGAGDSVGYRAWDDFPDEGDVTSWDSTTGLSWSSPEAGDAPIGGAAWPDFYGAMSVVVVGNEYYMYDTLDADNYSVGLLTAPVPEPSSMILLALGSIGLLLRRRGLACRCLRGFPDIANR